MEGSAGVRRSKSIRSVLLLERRCAPGCDGATPSTTDVTGHDSYIPFSSKKKVLMCHATWFGQPTKQEFDHDPCTQEDLWPHRIRRVDNATVVTSTCTCHLSFDAAVEACSNC